MEVGKRQTEKISGLEKGRQAVGGEAEAGPGWTG